LQPFLHRYNWHRTHSALNRLPPISRIPAMRNLLELNSQRVNEAFVPPGHGRAAKQTFANSRSWPTEAIHCTGNRSSHDQAGAIRGARKRDSRFPVTLVRNAVFRADHAAIDDE
jgi:hypothetical protein